MFQTQGLFFFSVTKERRLSASSAISSMQNPQPADSDSARLIDWLEVCLDFCCSWVKQGQTRTEPRPRPRCAAEECAKSFVHTSQTLSLTLMFLYTSHESSDMLVPRRHVITKINKALTAFTEDLHEQEMETHTHRVLGKVNHFLMPRTQRIMVPEKVKQWHPVAKTQDWNWKHLTGTKRNPFFLLHIITTQPLEISRVHVHFSATS